MFVYDGEQRTITEVVVGSPLFTSYDVQRDLWSRGQDYVHANQWSTIPWFRSGGASRCLDSEGNETFQNADFTLNAAEGWRIVLADYVHEAKFFGNIVSNDNGILFDFSNQSQPGAYPFIQGAADLLTYNINSDGNSGGCLPDTESISIKIENEYYSFQVTDSPVKYQVSNNIDYKAKEESIDIQIECDNDYECIKWSVC